MPTHCPVFGTPIGVAVKHFREGGDRGGGQSDSASLDRIDNTKGYVPGNIAVISWRANGLKSDASLEELEKLVAWLRSVQRTA